jgi:hypothetical protein
MKRILLLICIASGMMFTSCEIDNYAAPDGALTGELIDAVTQKPYISEQPNGFRINCTVIEWIGDVNVGAQSFWGKADGTFNNDKIFAGMYRVQPALGGFHTVQADTLEIRSKQVTVHNFTVTPYVSFSNVSIEKDPNVADGVIATFTPNKNVLYAEDGTTVKSKATIRDYMLFASKRTNKVGFNAYDGDVSTASTALKEEDLGKPVIVKQKGFQAGTTYYLRIGARCTESPDARYNMTEIVELQF